MWKSVRLEPIASGCPNRCRHCAEDAGAPFGELMPLADVRWAVEGLAGVCRATLGESFRVWVSEEGFEPTAHPQFPELIAYCRGAMVLADQSRCDALSTNGYGLARLFGWEPAFARLADAGVRWLGFAIHGLREEHDWFVRRTGAYQDIVTATERALAFGMGLCFEIHISRRNVGTFPRIVETLVQLGRGQARIWSGVPGYFANERLRAFEALRITRADMDALGEALLSAPDRGSDTESVLTRRLLEPDSASRLCTYEPGGAGPEERRLGRLRISPAFDVVEMFHSRPPLPHGNLRRDGAGQVWRSVLDAELPAMPEPCELAARYGDTRSELLYPSAESIHMKLADRCWQEA